MTGPAHTQDPPTDEALLAAARAGDASALEALLARHEGRVLRYGLRMCRHLEDARDVLQETLLAVARGLRSFRGSASVSTWLYTIARSFCIKKRRRSKFATAPDESLEATPTAGAVASTAAGPEEMAASRQVETAIQAAIASLKPMYRDVFVLRDMEGLPASEVATVLGLTVEAVKSRLHRARLNVREAVAPLLGVPVKPARAAGCPDILRTLSRHLEGELTPDICARMQAHVGGCPPCRDACDSLKHLLSVCSSTPEPRVPPELQANIRRELRAALG